MNFPLDSSPETTREALLAALAERDRELAEARRREEAMAEVLEIINVSSGDLTAAFDAIVEKAMGLCGASCGGLWAVDGDVARAGSVRNLPEPFRDFLMREPVPLTLLFGHAASDRSFLQFEDLAATQAYRDRNPVTVASVELGGVRTWLGVPLRAAGSVIGIVNLMRQETRPFSDGEIAIAQGFARQAQIAMMNARSFNATQEALEQQTAAAEILRVISSSPTDVQPVFDTILRAARKLCDAERATIQLLRDGAYHRVAVDGQRVAEHDASLPDHPIQPGRGSISGRVALERRVVHILDVKADPEFTYLREAGFEFRRTMLGVPLLRHGEAIGVIVLQRSVVRPFTEKQIGLVTTFADQAVIAINNVGLFNETQEALRQQTATADVLKVISRSAFDLQVVFDTLLGSAVALAGADSGVLAVRDGEVFRGKAFINKSPELVRFLSENPIPRGTGSVMGRVALSGRIESIEDTLADPGLAMRDVIRRTDDDRALVGVPLLREGRIEGAIVLGRREPGQFSARAIELTQTFADQAVIALENVRLFDEVQARTRDLSEALEQQTATADVLKVIASSPSDVQPVFDAVADRAMRLLKCWSVVVTRYDGEQLQFGAARGALPDTETYVRGTFPDRPNPNGFYGRCIREKQPVNDPDRQSLPDAEGGEYARRRGFHAALAVPMLAEGRVIGLITATRETIGAFADEDVRLLTTFADQAAIAINNVSLFNETREALQQQTATADVLKVISRSAFDLDAVLQILVGSAAKLCGADQGLIWLRKGDLFHYGADFGSSDEARAFLKANPRSLKDKSLVPRVARSGRTEHIPDRSKDPDFSFPGAFRSNDAKSLLGVPLLRDGRVEGVFTLTRSWQAPFADRQIELVQTFADQAVIAIENVRLFDEVQARTRDLSEALQHQTATADVLKVISRSAFGLPTVLQTLVDTAVRLCASDGVLYLRQGDQFVAAASFGSDVAGKDPRNRSPRRPGRDSVTGRVALSGRVEQIPDNLADPDFKVPTAQRMKMRSLLGVPLLRDGEVEGVFVLGRPEAGPFSDRAVELIQTFADQAVIAIQNVRLFDAVQAKTRDLEEALQQQTATADVLKVISRSAFDLQAVFDTLIASAVELCEANRGAIFLRDGDVFRLRAASTSSPEYFHYWEAHPARAGRGSATARVILSGKVESIPDVLEDADMEMPANTLVRIRATLGVPLLRDNQVEGVLVLTRPQPGDFTPRQVDLVQTFADQAVIAIENARLFDEVQARTRDLTDALQQQTATADVLKVISRSAFDLNVVLDTLTQSAATLCNASRGSIFLRDGDVYRAAAAVGGGPEYLEFLRANPRKPGRESAVTRVALSGVVEQIPDVLADPEFRFDGRTHVNPNRAVVGVPLLREGRVDGVFVLSRAEPGAFSVRQVELLKTFADQAVIAIENARLFDEVQAKTRDLTEALQQQTATADVLKVISRSAFDLQTVLDTLVASAARLCEAEKACVFQRRGDLYHWVSNFGFSPELVAYAETHPFAAGPGSTTSRVALEGRTIHNPDVLADPNYTASEYQRLGNYRTMLGVPLLREGEPIGVFIMTREVVRPFNQRQIELLQTFADQAVIAIENSRLFDEVQARTRDLTEALQQQTATADVLKVISRSAFDLDAVLATLVRSAQRLCDAQGSMIYIRDGDVYRVAAHVGMPDAFIRFRLDNPLRANRFSAVGRVALTGDLVHLPDVVADPDYQPAAPRLGDFRAVLSVPLVREDQVVGIFALNRPEPGLFSPGQVKLVQSFADQAAIAIANVRLFNEVKARTDDLAEALQQQTATADVLKVISRSAFNLQAVLDTLVESAYRLSGAAYGLIYLKTGEDFECKAIGGMGVEEGNVLFKGRPIRAGRGTAAERVISTGEIHTIPDLFADPEFDPKIKAAIRGAADSSPGFGSLRSLVAVPMKRDDAVIGVIVIARSETGSLPARQIELLQTFADQAVIAIENARLFDEVQARTRDLSEALQQQTATADVLKAISRSAFDLDAVLETLISSAVRLCNANYGQIFRRHGDVYRYAASQMEVDPVYRRYEETAEITPGRGTLVGRVALENRVVEVADAWSDPDYAEKDQARLGNVRAMLGVPLMRGGEPIGAFALARSEPIPFTQRQVELVTTFADQAVIAIENVRLFDALQAKTRDLSEALQQQTATAEVLKVISRSAFDLQAVIDTLIGSAVELCGALSGVICVRDGDVFRYRGSAGDGDTPSLLKYLEEHPATPGRGTIAGRVLLSGRTEAIPDRLEDPEFIVPMSSHGHRARALLGVPLLGKGGTEGVLVLTREQPGYFTDRQVEIVQTFADQAVIAIENVRLFQEVQARTRELATSLEDLRKTQDRLIQSEKLASLGQLTAGIAHEIKNPLNFVNNFSALSRELIDELGELLQNAPLDKEQRDEAGELIGMVGSNLDKVVLHGKRADSIVKNMLLHSREGSGERSSVNVNAMVEEALNLAYHGARAEKAAFNVTIAKSLDPAAGTADLYAQEMTRVLLNLISNGFYATTKRKQSESNGAYEPTISATTRDLGESVEIAIRDNGTGIPEEVKAKMFNPFFTTKPAGEGTGLGLSLSHDIVVKQHGGALEVSTEPGAYTQFTIVLPRESGGAR